MSTEDMMRMSRRRSVKDKENEEPTKPVTQQAANFQPSKTQTKELEKKETAEVAVNSKPANSPKAHATRTLPSDAADVASDTRKKPTEPLSFPERGRLSAANLDRIAQAMEAYLQDKGKYPPQAVYGPANAPLLSWRVELLPYLGYEELYDTFDRTKPWNSPANKPLLEKIPAVFQSPERFDTKTNYLLATGSSTLFPNARTMNLRRVEDGIEHTALVVEANDTLATPWTKPKEYKVNLQRPKNGLGQLRQENVFVIWGGGIAGAMPINLADKNFKAMFTIDGGESFSSYTVSVPLDEDYFANQPEVSSASLAKSPQLSESHTSAVNPKFGIRRSSRRSPVGLSSSLASEFYEAATTSYSMNQPANALLWYYASNLLQSDGARWDAAYRWMPALKRPSPTVHFCIGVLGAHKRNQRSHTVNSHQRHQENRGLVVSHIFEVGDRLLQIVEKHAMSLSPVAIATNAAGLDSGSSKKARAINHASPLPISYLGLGSRSELTREATKRAGDVLVLFETKSITSSNDRWIRCELIDLARGNKIISIPRIHWLQGATLESIEGDESYKKIRWQLEDALEDSLTPTDWPDGIKPKHAEARVAALSELKTLNSLAAMSEMAVYRNRGLIDKQRLLQGFRDLLGPTDGEVLMLGSDKKRKRVLRQWLPDIQPSELQQLAQLQRKAIDDDD